MQFLRRSFLKKFGQGFAALSLGSLGAQSYAQTKAKQEFYHQVFFWMKNPDNKEEQETFLKNLKTFLKACDKDKLFTQPVFKFMNISSDQSPMPVSLSGVRLEVGITSPAKLSVSYWYSSSNPKRCSR